MTKRRILKLAALSLALTVLLGACSGGTTEPADNTTGSMGFTKNADGYADITVQQLADLLKEEDVTLVNVHIPFEGDLPETDLSIPYDEIADHLDQLPDKDATVVLYCRSGSMSTSAAKELAARGYTNVLEVDGGFNAWKAAGYELLGE